MMVKEKLRNRKLFWECLQREKRGAGDGRQKIDEDIQVLIHEV